MQEARGDARCECDGAGNDRRIAPASAHLERRPPTAMTTPAAAEPAQQRNGGIGARGARPQRQRKQGRDGRRRQHDRDADQLARIDACCDRTNAGADDAQSP